MISYVYNFKLQTPAWRVRQAGVAKIVAFCFIWVLHFSVRTSRLVYVDPVLRKLADHPVLKSDSPV